MDDSGRRSSQMKMNLTVERCTGAKRRIEVLAISLREIDRDVDVAYDTAIETGFGAGDRYRASAGRSVEEPGRGIRKRNNATFGGVCEHDPQQQRRQQQKPKSRMRPHGNIMTRQQ